MDKKKYSEEIIGIIDSIEDCRKLYDKKMKTYTKKLIAEAKKLDDNYLLGYAYYMDADAHVLLDADYKSMNRTAAKAIEALRETDEYSLMARCYNLLGIDALAAGNRAMALDYYLTALPLAKLGKETNIEGFLSANIGDIYAALGDYSKAVSYIKKGTRGIGKNKKDGFYHKNMVLVYTKCGTCYLKQGKLAEAEREYRKALDMYEKDPSPVEFPAGFLLKQLEMNVAFKKGDIKKRDLLIHDIMEKISRYEMTADSVDDMLSFGHMLLDMEEYSVAKDMADYFKDQRDRLQGANLQINVEDFLIRYYKCIGDEKNATEAIKAEYAWRNELEKETLRAERHMIETREKLERMNEENARLSRQAHSDELTGLPNRYDLNEYADEAFNRARANDSLLAVEILDVDYFKQYNDTYGHKAGDDCLKKVASEIKKLVGANPGVYAARYGGDEFVILYEGYTDEKVREMAMALRNNVKALNILNEGAPENKQVSISQGIRNSVPVHGNRLWDYLYAADNALYYVKRSTKGEVELIHKAVISQ
ncbi:MAG: diguanylate cyclase, partial [Lachnospiraceae bacterium]|nr:diguanylate cyclase [Lachnospiraceae bacterium]